MNFFILTILLYYKHEKYKKWKWKTLSRVWLFATPWTCSLLGSFVHGILQTRNESVAMPSSRGSSQSRDHTQVSHIAGEFFTVWAIREAQEYWSG